MHTTTPDIGMLETAAPLSMEGDGEGDAISWALMIKASDKITTIMEIKKKAIFVVLNCAIVKEY
ncbi:hypothetical protein BVC80_1309g10 [Macleaya cordata]|uniref:Uncharacterized protein n=1 Tax=Macleaya cordata TaxID=56857 RepID=A0A200R3A5_MACCD|nr:hypothetical protein BVC80_1309g10 [Macleaya cordata]